MSRDGRVASPGDLSNAGFTADGVSKNSVGSGMMSDAWKSGSGQQAVSDLQSAGAKNTSFSGGNTTRSAMDDAGFTSRGISKDSVGANTMSSAYTSDSGKGVVSSLQSAGARK